MRILYVANLASGFIRKFNIPEILYFRKNGWEVDIACGMDAPIPEASHCYDMKWKRNPFSFRVIVGIFKLHHLLNSKHYDIVYSMTPVGGLAGRLSVPFSKKKRPATIYFAHGFHFYRGSGLLSWLLYYPVEKTLSRRTDLLITTNQEDYSISTTKFHAKKYYITNELGISIDRFSNAVISKNEVEQYKSELNCGNMFPILMYSAEISKTKNQKYLLFVLKKLKRDGYNPLLLLAGRDMSSGKFGKIIKVNDLSDNVRLLGFRNDIPKILLVSDYYVASSIREGLGLSVVEAMASGVLVFAVDNRGSRTIIQNEKNGFLFSKKYPDSMAEKIEEMINDKQTSKRLIANAKVDAKKYDFGEVFPKLFSEYTSVIK